MTNSKSKDEVYDKWLQVGNFVCTIKDGYVTVRDINTKMSYMLDEAMPLGRMVAMAINNGNENFLNCYAAMVWNLSSIVLDVRFMEDLIKACSDCVNRYKSFYGVKEDISDEDDARILKEERELKETVDKMLEEPKE